MSLTKRVHNIEVTETAERVRVLLGDEVLADTTRALVLTEGRLPPRWYIPEEDLRAELLEPSEHTSRCPWKGKAIYRSARVGEHLEEAVAWCYPEPKQQVAPIAGRWAFYQERLDVRRT